MLRLRTFPPCVGLLRVARLLLGARAVPRGELRLGIQDVLVRGARADRDHDREAVAGADDHVLGAAGAVHEVPRAQRPLFALDEQHGLAGEHEEVLLRVLLVVEAERLAGLQHADVDPELLEWKLAALERGAGAEGLVLVPGGVADVDDEPPVGGGLEAGFRLLELCFVGHEAAGYRGGAGRAVPRHLANSWALLLRARTEDQVDPRTALVSCPRPRLLGYHPAALSSRRKRLGDLPDTAMSPRNPLARLRQCPPVDVRHYASDKRRRGWRGWRRWRWRR